MYQFSTLEISTVHNMLLTKTNKEIAAVLDLPVEVIARLVSSIEADTGLVSKTTRVNQTRPSGRPQKAVKQKKAPAIQNPRYRQEQKKREQLTCYETKEVKLNELHAVRIDHKTTIFIKPGQNADEARAAYASREKSKQTTDY